MIGGWSRAQNSQKNRSHHPRGNERRRRPGDSDARGVPGGDGQGTAGCGGII